MVLKSSSNFLLTIFIFFHFAQCEVSTAPQNHWKTAVVSSREWPSAYYGIDIKRATIFSRRILFMTFTIAIQGSNNCLTCFFRARRTYKIMLWKRNISSCNFFHWKARKTIEAKIVRAKKQFKLHGFETTWKREFKCNFEVEDLALGHFWVPQKTSVCLSIS